MPGGRRGGERPRRQNQQEGRYTKAARKDHVVLHSRRTRRLPPWLPGFRSPREGALRDRQLVPRKVQPADQGGQGAELDTERRALFSCKHPQCEGQSSSFTL